MTYLLVFVSSHVTAIVTSYQAVAWSIFQVRTNVSKLSEKYCVPYFLLEIVVWIQAKSKASCRYFEQTWRKQGIVLVVDPRACAQQHFSFYSTVIIYIKQRARRVFLNQAEQWLILCFTICVLSATQHNIHMYPYFLFAAIHHLNRPRLSLSDLVVQSAE